MPPVYRHVATLPYPTLASGRVSDRAPTLPYPARAGAARPKKIFEILVVSQKQRYSSFTVHVVRSSRRRRSAAGIART